MWQLVSPVFYSDIFNIWRSLITIYLFGWTFIPLAVQPGERCCRCGHSNPPRCHLDHEKNQFQFQFYLCITYLGQRGKLMLISTCHILMCRWTATYSYCKHFRNLAIILNLQRSVCTGDPVNDYISIVFIWILFILTNFLWLFLASLLFGICLDFSCTTVRSRLPIFSRNDFIVVRYRLCFSTLISAFNCVNCARRFLRFILHIFSAVDFASTRLSTLQMIHRANSVAFLCCSFRRYMILPLTNAANKNEGNYTKQSNN